MKEYRVFFVLFGIIALAVAGIWLYNKYLEPFKELENQNKTIAELKQNQSEMSSIIEANQTIVKKVEVTKTSGWTTLWFLLALILAIVLIYLLTRMRGDKLYTREEIIKHLRGEGFDNIDGYSLKIDNIRLYTIIKYYEYSYKADITLPLAIAVFSTSPEWTFETGRATGLMEPQSAYVRGFIINRKNLDIIEDFLDMSVKDIIEQAKLTHWGMRAGHYMPYDKKTHADAAVAAEKVEEQQEIIRQAIERHDQMEKGY